MKELIDKTQEPQNTTVQKVLQEPGTDGTATIVDNRPSAVYQRKLREMMNTHDTGNNFPVQLKKSKGSSTFQQIALGMGEKYGVDTSGLISTHNSSFPEKLNAEATIQGTNIHFAPRQDTEYNIRHEVAHAIDNSINGTPKANKVINGQRIDTTREKVVDKMANGNQHNKAWKKKGVINKTHGITVVQRIGGVKGNDEEMKQKAGTCGIYALANAIVVAYGKNGDNAYRNDVKNKLLKVAGKLPPRITAQGELLSYNDILILVKAYNEDQDEPNDSVELERRQVPENDNEQRWLNAIGEGEGKNVLEDDLNEEAVGAMIAVDLDVMLNYDRNLEDDTMTKKYTSMSDITGSKNSSGGHWVTIVRVNGKIITIHDSHKDIEKEYPIWLIRKATLNLNKSISKVKYFKEVFKSSKEFYNLDANEQNFAKSMTSDLKMNKSNKLIFTKDGKMILDKDKANNDFAKMYGEEDPKQQRSIVVRRIRQTLSTNKFTFLNPYKPKVSLKGLIIRVKPSR